LVRASPIFHHPAQQKRAAGHNPSTHRHENNPQSNCKQLVQLSGHSPHRSGGGWVRGLAAVLLLAGTLPAVADQTIYQDLFNDQQNINRGVPYTQSLGGSAPTTRNSIGGGSSSATWTFAAETNGWGQSYTLPSGMDKIFARLVVKQVP